MKEKKMVLGGIVLGILLILAIIGMTIFLPIAIIASLFTPGKAVWVVLFVIAKKTDILRCSWWWILLGLLLPF